MPEQKGSEILAMGVQTGQGVGLSVTLIVSNICLLSLTWPCFSKYGKVSEATEAIEAAALTI